MERTWAYGWRAWIGRIEPSYRWVEGPIWERTLPDGVDIIVSCLGVERLTDEDLQRAHDNILAHVRRFAAEPFIDVINVGGSPVVGLKGYAAHEHFRKELEEITDKPIVTSLGAAFDALETLRLKKLVVVTPYKEKPTRNRIEVLTDAGFEVVGAKYLGLEKNTEFCTEPSQSSYRLTREAIMEFPEADGIYIGCSGWPAAAHVEHLERDYGKPVVYSQLAQIWACLRAAGIREPVEGFGMLLRDY